MLLAQANALQMHQSMQLKKGLIMNYIDWKYLMGLNVAKVKENYRKQLHEYKRLYSKKEKYGKLLQHKWEAHACAKVLKKLKRKIIESMVT